MTTFSYIYILQLYIYIYGCIIRYFSFYLQLFSWREAHGSKDSLVTGTGQWTEYTQRGVSSEAVVSKGRWRC